MKRAAHVAAGKKRQMDEEQAAADGDGEIGMPRDMPVDMVWLRQLKAANSAPSHNTTAMKIAMRATPSQRMAKVAGLGNRSGMRSIDTNRPSRSAKPAPQKAPNTIR